MRDYGDFKVLSRVFSVLPLRLCVSASLRDILLKKTVWTLFSRSDAGTQCREEGSIVFVLRGSEQGDSVGCAVHAILRTDLDYSWGPGPKPRAFDALRQWHGDGGNRRTDHKGDSQPHASTCQRRFQCLTAILPEDCFDVVLTQGRRDAVRRGNDKLLQGLVLSFPASLRPCVIHSCS
jgi:hypothetical protein